MDIIQFIEARLEWDDSYPFAVDEEDPWEYTRDLDIKPLRYKGQKYPWKGAIRSALYSLFPSIDRSPLSKVLRKSVEGLRSRLLGAYYSFSVRMNRHEPDGRVGTIYTFWEEDGEYIENWSPVRTRRETEFKRFLLSQHRPDTIPLQAFGRPPFTGCAECMTEFPCRVVREMAALYRDHEDYDQSWAIES